MSDVGEGHTEHTDASSAESSSDQGSARASDPPLGASNDPVPEPTSDAIVAGSGLPENVAGALAYVLGPITGVLFFILDRQRAFVRFHAVQCIAVCVVMVALSIALTILSMVLAFIPILGWLIGLLLSLGLGLGGFALWIWLMLQAYQGKEWALPGLDQHVRRLSAETGTAPPR